MRNKSDYIKDRDKDLLRAFRRIIAEKDVRSMKEAVRLAVNSESARYWISPECVAKYISRMKKGDMLLSAKPLKREMMLSLYGLYSTACEKELKGKSMIYICTVLVDRAAPKFYLSEDYAKKIIEKQRRRNRCERMSMLPL